MATGPLPMEHDPWPKASIFLFKKGRFPMENPGNPDKIVDLGSRVSGGPFLRQILLKDMLKSSVELFGYALD